MNDYKESKKNLNKTLMLCKDCNSKGSKPRGDLILCDNCHRKRIHKALKGVKFFIPFK